jgi:uncharacterized membrane protein
MKKKIISLSIIIILGTFQTALAYIGPGAGLSLLGALWGLLLAVGAAFGFLILWPLRRIRKRARAKNNENETGTGDNPSGPPR